MVRNARGHCKPHLAQGLAKLESLVSKALDVLRNRVIAGLRWIAAAPLVDLAGDRLYGYEELEAWQAPHLSRQAEAIAVRWARSQACSPAKPSLNPES